MEIIKKTVGVKSITGNTIGFTIFLYNEFDNLGYYTDLSDTSTLDTTGATVTITGYTASKLSSVRSFDINNPYVIGVNGVTDISGSLIMYTINTINYVTDISTTGFTTTFNTSYQDINYGSNSFVMEEKNLSLVDKVSIDNSVNIERQNISIIANFSKLRQITSVSEISTFNNGFYQIFDQTI